MKTRSLSIVLAVSLAACMAMDGQAAEGGYSNYVPGTYGDFAMAVAPQTKWMLRNDVYVYGADSERSVRSGLLETAADLDFIMNFTTVLYKPDVEFLGGQYAFGVFAPIVQADIEATVTLGCWVISRARQPVLAPRCCGTRRSERKPSASS
jgi:hypothetical protein